VARLRRHGVTQACAGSFDALLHKNIAAVNASLAEECRRHGRGLLIPFGALNLKLPEWEEDLRRCHEQFHMPGVRLYPNYHGYSLDDPRFAKILDFAQARGMTVQLALSMEDERTQHPLVRVPHVDAMPLLGLLPSRPLARVVLLNWSRAVNGKLVPKLAQAGQVYFDIATVEGVGGITNLLKQVPAERVLFGSHAPFFYFESAVLKLKESVLTDAELSAIRSANAQHLLPMKA
jgi:predicted TIM-barrel fold metal-dependent hydrolase